MIVVFTVSVIPLITGLVAVSKAALLIDGRKG
jgi:hypothetical protein